MRGNHEWTARRPYQQGSIPACAGEPKVAYASQPVYKVYPRVCGGTTCSQRLSQGMGGLSPRVRGNQCHGQPLMELTGSIPACAGEPSTDRERKGGSVVYPRVCGGTPPRQPGLRVAEGLSPRVRGNRLRVAELRINPGSIPACAGEPRRYALIYATTRVYPRVCGGTYDAIDANRFTVGLSPRVRGNPTRR